MTKWNTHNRKAQTCYGVLQDENQWVKLAIKTKWFYWGTGTYPCLTQTLSWAVCLRWLFLVMVLVPNFILFLHFAQNPQRIYWHVIWIYMILTMEHTDYINNFFVYTAACISISDADEHQMENIHEQDLFHSSGSKCNKMDPPITVILRA